MKIASRTMATTIPLLLLLRDNRVSHKMGASIAGTSECTTPGVPVMHVNITLIEPQGRETHPHVLTCVVAVSAELEDVGVVDTGLVAVADHNVRLRDRLVGGHG